MDPLDSNFNVDDIEYADDDWLELIQEQMQNISELEYILRLQLRMEGPDAVQSTLEQCINLNLGPLHMAASSGNVDLARLLIRYGCDVNCIDDTSSNKIALDYAAENGYLPMIYTLVRLGANMNIENCGYMVPILYALSEGKDDAVIALKALGADTDLDISEDKSLIFKQLNEDEILYHRYKTYFELSLVNRLLFDAII